MPFAKIVIDAAMIKNTQIWDYIVPDGMDCAAGSRVIAPFGKREAEGFVLSITDTPPILSAPKTLTQTVSTPQKTPPGAIVLKPISRLADDFVAVKPELLELLPEICNRFKLRYIDVLRLFVPGIMRSGRVRAKKNGQRRIPKSIYTDDQKVVLTPEQQKCVDDILSGTGVFVLHGVTGSGKTEVYMNAIIRVLEQGRTALMLVPEIGLTPQVLSNFKARFGEIVAILHSGLAAGERFDEWKRVHSGEARIVIGARSAVFAPLENLGIIIIDEEHDGSYQSESNPRYFTHDIAIMRSAKNHCPVVLGSATPSVETYFNTRPASTSSGCNDNIKTKYRLLEMKNRVNGVAMPGIEIVDMVHEIRSGNGGIFARSFLQSLFETLKKGRSAMIFLNRRGYSQSVRCMQCGWVAKCQNCDISLVYHRDEEQLKCHYCDARFTIMAQCPNCGGKYLRYGVIGTQKVAAELERLLADGGLAVPVLRMDADNTKTKDSLIDILNKFASAAPSVLVGTQMIAKGHHFPDVDFVGVVDADASLHVGDYRSAERTFSLLTQVAGRAGRETGSRSSVFIQTYMPKHYVYKFVQSYDYKGFYEKEINTRAATKYPPFSVIARVLVSGGAEIKIKSVLEAIMKKLRGHPGVVSRPDPFLYLGAMKCPHGRLQNKFRYQVLARISRQDAAFVIDCIDDAVKSVQPDARGIQIFLEINPGNLT